MKELLLALKDINGVDGVYLVNGQGNLVANEMPAFYGEEDLLGTARRVRELISANEDTLPEPDSATVRFTRGLIFARFWKDGVLVVFCNNNVHAPALRTAVSLTVKRLVKMPMPTANNVARPATKVPPSNAPAAPVQPGKQKTRFGIWG